MRRQPLHSHADSMKSGSTGQLILIRMLQLFLEQPNRLRADITAVWWNDTSNDAAIGRLASLDSSDNEQSHKGTCVHELVELV